MTRRVTNLQSHGPWRSHVFIHIPKAAGTSFGKFLTKKFSPDEQVNGYWEELRKKPIADLHNYRLVWGHFGYELTHYLHDPFIMTVLRDPVDRLLSVYHFLRQVYEDRPDLAHSDQDISELVQLWKKVSQRTLPEFLESPEPAVRAALLENPQSRQLAQATPYLLTDLSADDMYQIASSRLDQIHVVGCTEHLQPTISLTCKHLGWQEPTREFRARVTRARPSRSDIGRPLRQQIERMAGADRELYQQANRRLRADCKRLGIALPR